MRNIFRITLIFILLLIFSAFLSKNTYAKWYYPMDKFYERQTVKGFGDNINENFYIGKENLFPYNRFYGFHTGIDLDISNDEIDKKIPVYAAYSGTISYIGELVGYGGVILEKFDNENSTALYGHVKIKNLIYRIGDHLSTEKGPVILTYLGDQFSTDTSNERKHLHFGIYKGNDLYFKGHENTIAQLKKKWYDPNVFLKEKQAILPIMKSSSDITLNNTVNNTIEKKNIVFLLINFIKKMLSLSR